jgi:hypothetical protein
VEKNNKNSDLTEEKIRLLRERLTDENYIKGAIEKIAEDVSSVIVRDSKPRK